jgi:hypothetical protein
LKLAEGRNQLVDVVLQVFLSQVSVSNTVVQRNLYSGLEQTDLSNDRVEEADYVYSAVLVSVKLQEGRGGKEVPAFRRKRLSNCEERIVVYSVSVVIRGRDVLSN